ncbi:hypothetical protein HY639_03185 [Candidatus Woesearchaeota archaeon]|nr:hypothetical protein [Candidatus Woesearchaeota archaeon]
MIDPKIALAYYSRSEIQDAIVAHARDKEAVGTVQGESFRKRPDVLQYPGDILELARQGVTSFHASEELWFNPLLLKPGMNKKEIEENRKGWDLLLDIDCPDLEFSRVAAFFLVEALRYHDLQSFSIKFSGNHGFHIGVPFEAFPEKIGNRETRTLFPDVPRAIASYLQAFIRKHLKQKLLEKCSMAEISARVKKEELLTDGEFDPFKVLSIDTILLASRHLYRMPYSCHEKSGLVSIPILSEEILTFPKELAQPEKVIPARTFLARDLTTPSEARRLVREAFDHKTPSEVYTTERKTITFTDSPDAIPEQLFPPCINNILKGLEDGKKRSLFTLMNFLQCANWPHDKIDNLVREWNKRNPEPLKETIVVGQLRYAAQKNEKILPANCARREHYADLGICTPDSFCRRIRNPVQYAKRKAWLSAKDKEQKPAREKLSDEQKAMRRQFREKQKST